jgi:hypothetical protein
MAELHDPVKIKGTVIEAQVVQVKFNEDTGARRLLVAWDNPEDAQTHHERWFDESENALEVIPDAPDEPHPAAVRRQKLIDQTEAQARDAAAQQAAPQQAQQAQQAPPQAPAPQPQAAPRTRR